MKQQYYKMWKYDYYLRIATDWKGTKGQNFTLGKVTLEDRDLHVNRPLSTILFTRLRLQYVGTVDTCACGA